MRVNTEYNSHKNNVGFGARILATDATRKAFEYANQLLYRNNKEDFLVVDKFCKGMDKALNYPSNEYGFVNYVGRDCIGFGVPACPKIISTNYKLNAPWLNAWKCFISRTNTVRKDISATKCWCRYNGFIFR